MQSTNGNTIVGTNIGTAIDSTPMGNGGDGIFISGTSSYNTIGSTAANAAENVIAYNGPDGVYIASGYATAIRQNSIYGNDGLGIDSAPVRMATRWLRCSSQSNRFRLAQVSGSLQSTPNSQFTIESFGNATNDASGRDYLGSTSVQTNAAGVAGFSITASQLPAGVQYFTATATSLANNTSEFSNSLNFSNPLSAHKLYGYTSFPDTAEPDVGAEPARRIRTVSVD